MSGTGPAPAMYNRGYSFGGPPGAPSSLLPVQFMIATANDTSDWSTAQLSDLSNVSGVTGTASTAGTHTVVGSVAPTITGGRFTDPDGDSFIEFSTATDDLLIFNLLGTQRFYMQNNRFRSQLGGAMFKNAVASATVPVFCPLVASTNTGIGAANTGSVSVINSGNENLRVDATNNVGQTRLIVWDVDTGKLQRVYASTNNSGGTGFRVLRIANST